LKEALTSLGNDVINLSAIIQIVAQQKLALEKTTTDASLKGHSTRAQRECENG